MSIEAGQKIVLIEFKRTLQRRAVGRGRAVPRESCKLGYIHPHLIRVKRDEPLPFFDQRHAIESTQIAQAPFEIFTFGDWCVGPE